MARPSHLFECLEHGPDGRCRLRLLTLEWSVQQARQRKREKEERHGRGDGHRRLRGGERKDLGWRVEEKEPKKDHEDESEAKGKRYRRWNQSEAHSDVVECSGPDGCDECGDERCACVRHEYL